MKLIAPRAFIDSIKTVVNFPFDTIIASFMVLIAIILFIGAGLAPPILLFYIITAFQLWSHTSTLIFIAFFILTYIIVWYFVSAYTAAYARIMYDLNKTRRKPSFFRFVELGLCYGPNIFVYVIIKNFVLLILAAPVLGLLYQFNMLGMLGVPAAIILYTIIWFATLFAPCSILLERSSAFVAMQKTLNFIIKRPLDTVITALIIIIPFVLVTLIPIVNIVIDIFILMPISWLMLMLMYDYSRAVY